MTTSARSPAAVDCGRISAETKGDKSHENETEKTDSEHGGRQSSRLFLAHHARRRSRVHCQQDPDTRRHDEVPPPRRPSDQEGRVNLRRADLTWTGLFPASTRVLMHHPRLIVKRVKTVGESDFARVRRTLRTPINPCT